MPRVKSATALVEPSTGRFVLFAFFVICIFLFGGGSRDDIQSLLFIRPLAICAAALGLCLINRDQLAGRSIILYTLLVVAGSMIVQLIPLPVGIWTSLQGHGLFADIAAIAGLDPLPRPLSLSPSKTLNSLFSLVVPIAATILYLNLDRGDRTKALTIIIILFLVSAMIAIVQLASSPNGPLYFYRITNNGQAVGLFANRNHQAVMMTVAMVLIGWYGSSQKRRDALAALKFNACGGVIFILVPLVVITGSRSGLLLMTVALPTAIYILFSGSYSSSGLTSQKNRKLGRVRLLLDRRVLLILTMVATLLLLGLTFLLSRSLAFDRLLGSTESNSLRFDLLPSFYAMIKEYFPFGSGFGSFEHVYKIFEEREYLAPSYLNQAHNDWFQIVIEAGIFGILLCISVAVWIVSRLILIYGNPALSRNQKNLGLSLFIVFVMLGLASFVDYPIRVPSIITSLAVFACIYNDLASRDKRSDRLQSSSSGV